MGDKLDSILQSILSVMIKREEDESEVENKSDFNRCKYLINELLNKDYREATEKYFMDNASISWLYEIITGTESKECLHWEIGSLFDDEVIASDIHELFDLISCNAVDWFN